MSWLSISQLLLATSISIGANFLRKPGQKRLAQDAIGLCDDHFPGWSKSCWAACVLVWVENAAEDNLQTLAHWQENLHSYVQNIDVEYQVEWPPAEYHTEGEDELARLSWGGLEQELAKAIITSQKYERDSTKVSKVNINCLLELERSCREDASSQRKGFLKTVKRSQTKSNNNGSRKHH